MNNKPCECDICIRVNNTIQGLHFLQWRNQIDEMNGVKK